MYLYGELFEEDALGSDAGRSVVRIKEGQTLFARFELHDEGADEPLGDLRIGGVVYANMPVALFEADRFVMRKRNAAGEVVAAVDSDGNLHLRGGFVERARGVEFVSTFSYAEENSPSVSLPVRLSHASTETFTVEVTLGGEATRELDYSVTTTTVTFEPGATATSFTIDLYDDLASEGLETLTATLTTPKYGYLLENTTHTVTLIDDEALIVGGMGFGTIQAAIDAALSSETIYILPGVYTERIHLDGKSLTLQSIAPYSLDAIAGTVIDGTDATSGSAVTFAGTESSDCLLVGLTIRGGDAGLGGGIQGNGAAATLWNCVIVDNLATQGGGVAGLHGVIQNCVIANNTAATGAGLYDCDGDVRNSTLTGNVGSVEADGLYGCGGTIRNTIVWNGGISELASCAAPSHCVIRGWSGGGAAIRTADPLFVDADSIPEGLRIGAGGALDTGQTITGNFYPEYDMRLTLRPFGSAWDIGALESDNTPPSIAGLIDVTLHDASETATLTATITDDGKLEEAGLTAVWSKVSGPGEVLFGQREFASPPASSLDASTTARFSKFGEYTLRLSVSDGMYTTSQTVTVSAPLDFSEPLWATHFGGNRYEGIFGVAADSQDRVLIYGAAVASDGSSPTVPTSGTHALSHGGGVDVFVARLSTDGVSLDWSTYFGGSSTEFFQDSQGRVVTDPDDNVYIVGQTASSNLPGHVNTYGGGLGDGFIAKFAADGELLWSRYIGAAGTEFATSIAFDPYADDAADGALVVVGATSFTLTGESASHGARDSSDNAYSGFVGRFSAASGGQKSIKRFNLDTSGSPGGHDVARDVALKADGDIIVAVESKSDYSGGLSRNAAWCRLGSDLTWEAGAALPTPADRIDIVHALALDAAGDLYLAGHTNAPTFPGSTTTHPAFDVPGLGFEGFVTKVEDGVATWTFLLATPSTLASRVYDIAVDTEYVYVAGQSVNSTDTFEQSYGDYLLSQLTLDGDVVSTSVVGELEDPATQAGNELYTALTLDTSGRVFVAGGAGGDYWSNHTQTAGRYQPARAAPDSEFENGIDELDGFVAAFQARTPNRPPTVDAGADTEAEINESIWLTGTAGDDGWPSPPGELATTWTLISGPGGATFTAPNTLQTQVSFTSTGAHLIQLAAGDGGSEVTDTLTVTVYDRPPATPTGLVGWAGVGAAQLDWDDNDPLVDPDLAGYYVYRYTTTPDAATTLTLTDVIIDPEPSSWLDQDGALSPGTTYHYFVRALDLAGNMSGPSSSVAIEPVGLCESPKPDWF